jgi:hypothetical protein
MPKLYDDQRLSEAASYFALSCTASREHDRAASVAFEKFGSHGPQVSGCVRAHFPEDLKTHLRSLAKLCRYYSDRAHQSRPKRVRTDTMRELGRQIAERDGAGFYGPQPGRYKAA